MSDTCPECENLQARLEESEAMARRMGSEAHQWKSALISLHPHPEWPANPKAHTPDEVADEVRLMAITKPIQEERDRRRLMIEDRHAMLLRAEASRDAAEKEVALLHKNLRDVGKTVDHLTAENARLKELLRVSQHHVERDWPECQEFLRRAMDLLGKDFAMSGSAALLAPTENP